MRQESKMSSAEAQAADPLQLPKDLFSGACGGIAQVLIGECCFLKAYEKCLSNCFYFCAAGIGKDAL